MKKYLPYEAVSPDGKLVSVHVTMEEDGQKPVIITTTLTDTPLKDLKDNPTPHVKAMTMAYNLANAMQAQEEKAKLEVYRLRKVGPDKTWANIYVDQVNEESAFLLIHSDYGSWSYYFSHCGKAPKKFFIGVTGEYLKGKLGQGLKAVDTQRFLEEMLSKVHNCLINGSISADSAMEMSETITECCMTQETVDGVISALNGTTIYEFFEEKVGWPEYMFYPVGLETFVKHIWPVFVERLKIEDPAFTAGLKTGDNA